MTLYNVWAAGVLLSLLFMEYGKTAPPIHERPPVFATAFFAFFWPATVVVVAAESLYLRRRA